jgi:hypothetical protein
VVVGVTTGEAIDTGNIHSADLLLVPGVVAVDIDEPAPSHATRTHDPLAEDAGGVAEEVSV